MDDFNPFAGGEILRVSPATAPQKEIIACAQLSDEANTAFNEAVLVAIDGAIDADLLKRCFDIFYARHDILRTTFSRKGDEICLQEDKVFDLNIIDLSNKSESEQQNEIDDLKKNIAISPMNLEEGPLFFAWLIKRSDQRHDLLIAAHHIVCDGWSIGLMLTELATLYRNEGNESALKPSPSFFDFADKHAAERVFNQDIDYWTERFKESPPALDLPLDFNRPPVRTFQASRLDFELQSELAKSLPKAAAAQKASVVNMVLAAYFALLHRLTNNEQIVVGLPVAGQVATNQVALFGHMVQLIPIKLELSSDISFAQLLQNVKSEVLNASEHPNFTFGELLETIKADRTRVPLITTIFNIDQAMPPLDFGSAQGTMQAIPRAAEAFEIFLNVVPSPEALTIEATYSTALFKEESIYAWLEALQTILSEVSQNPDTPIGDLKLTTSLPEKLINLNANEQQVIYNDLVSAIQEQTQKSPNATAIIADNGTLTYQALEAASTQLAKILRSHNVSEGDVVGVCGERTTDLIVSVLAILKLGASYLPLDPGFPEERLVYMLEDSNAVAVIEDNSAPSGVREAKLQHIDLTQLSFNDAPDTEIPTLTPNSNRCAYVIYTSGSTGKPKGVRIGNGSMMNFLESMAKKPGCSASDRLLAITTLSFDISVLEMYLPLIVGGTTVIASRSAVKEGDKLASLIQYHGITMIQATPSTWRLLLASHWNTSSLECASKPKALCGGEPLPLDLVEQLLPRVKELWNMYGPTETTVWSTCKQILNTQDPITVGTPIHNTQVYILDKNYHPVPLSTPGEIFIGGQGVALGYHNRPDLNAERFIEHSEFGRIYRTGDLAKITPNGEIQHLGRLDDQIKLRGYRIELGEIEAALTSFDGIDSAAAYLWQPSPNDVRLVACCVPSPQSSFRTAAIRKHLREKLPNYMVPQYLLEVDEIPLLPNRKINRSALPKPEIGESSLLSQKALQNDTERLIAQIWTEVVKPPRAVSPDDNFFEIGGHSLLALEAIRLIEEKTGHRFTSADLVLERLSALAEAINQHKESQTSAESTPEPLPNQVMRLATLEQEKIIEGHLLDPNTTCNNLPAAWLLTGELDEAALKHSLKSVFERQTALRSRIGKKDSQFYLYLTPIDDTATFNIEDVSNKESPLDAALENANQLSTTPFEILDNSLCRIKIYKLAQDQHLLLLVPHQLIFDGWSFDIFLSELEKYYEAFSANKASDLRKLRYEFRDYTHWYRQKPTNSDHLQFHQRSLEETAKVDFNLINTNAAQGSCERHSIEFDQQDLTKLEAFCSRHHMRLHEVLFSAFVTGLSKVVGSQEITVGLPVTGRYDPDVINLVGSFVSTLPFTARIRSGGFLTTAKDISAQLTEFHNHQNITYAEIIKSRTRKDIPVADIMPASFGYQDVRNRPTHLANLNLSQIDMNRTQTELPVEFWVRIHAKGFIAVFDYNAAQITSDNIANIGSAFENTIRHLDQAEAQAISSGPKPTEPETKKPFWRRLFQ